MNAAVIVETRKLNNIRTVIKNHFLYLGKDWELFVFHGRDNGYLFLELKAKLIKVKHDIGVGFPAGNHQGYNNLITSKAFWQQIPHEKVLIFQHDSGLLRHGIDEFLKWDYVGSPIPSFTTQNGGLSLRTKSVMLSIIRESPFKASLYNTEDDYFCKNIHKFGKLAPPAIASQFACETVFKLGTLGYHAIDKHMSKHQCNLIRNQNMKINEEEDFRVKQPEVIKTIVKNEIDNFVNESFNEERYLFENPDVAGAVKRGMFISGFEHYAKFGYFEGRRALIYSLEELHLFFKSDFKSNFNDDEYLESNPDVRRAVNEGHFASGYEHYRRYGYFENRL